MMTTAATEIPTPPVALQPKREERSHRFIRRTLIVLILLSIVSGYATRPALNGEMRRVLRDSTIVEVIRTNADWARPFLSWDGRELVARHRTLLQGTQETKGMMSYFTGRGVYLGSRSALEPDPYARRQPAELERALAENGERYARLDASPLDLNVATLLQRVSQDVELKHLEAFELFPVTFETAAEGAVPALVAHLWCATEYQSSETTNPRRCGAAERVVIRLDTNETIRRDSLL